MWKTAYDIQYYLIPSLVELKDEQEAILADPNITGANRTIAEERKKKLDDGINGWTATLEKNRVRLVFTSTVNFCVQ